MTTLISNKHCAVNTPHFDARATIQNGEIDFSFTQTTPDVRYRVKIESKWAVSQMQGLTLQGPVAGAVSKAVNIVLAGLSYQTSQTTAWRKSFSNSNVAIACDIELSREPQRQQLVRFASRLHTDVWIDLVSVTPASKPGVQTKQWVRSYFHCASQLDQTPQTVSMSKDDRQLWNAFKDVSELVRSCDAAGALKRIFAYSKEEGNWGDKPSPTWLLQLPESEKEVALDVLNNVAKLAEVVMARWRTPEKLSDELSLGQHGKAVALLIPMAGNASTLFKQYWSELTVLSEKTALNKCLPMTVTIGPKAVSKI